jgi:uncharacterized membrane protein (DUF4010 family)
VVSGLTDMDAITLSSLRLHNLGQIEAAQAVIAITIAMVSNMVFKFGLIRSIGSKELARHCLPGMAAIVVGLGLGAIFI